MSEPLLRLYPLPSEETALEGLYLEAPLEPAGADPARAFLYTNYVVSLDGRIAVPAGPGGAQQVPESTANARDWRLFQELAGRCDVLLTSGRYFRELAAGQAQADLPVSSAPRFQDIHTARRRRGLAPQPDVAVLSAGLDLPLPPGLGHGERRLLAFTGERAPAGRCRALERQGAELVSLPGENVDGGAVVAHLESLGYRHIYCVTGARVLHTLLAANRLDSLFLTLVPRLLGGQPFQSLVDGPMLNPPPGYRLRWLYLDRHSPEATGQMFARFERVA